MKTIYMISLEVSKLLDIPHTILPNTTLNEKYGVGSSQPSTQPIVNYFSIGMSLETQYTNGVYNLNRNRHRPTDGSVFFPLPFMLVKLSLDLSLDERLEYRIRKELIIGGERYAAYYLKRILDVNHGNFLNVTIGHEGGEEISMFSSAKSSILSPTPVPYSEFKDDASFEAVAYTKPIRLALTPLELQNIEESMKLLYPDTNTGNIGDIALFSGTDTLQPNGSIEADGCQACMFLESDITVKDVIDDGVTHLMELGGVELMRMDDYGV